MSAIARTLLAVAIGLFLRPQSTVAQNQYLDSLKQVVESDLADTFKFTAYKDLAWEYRRMNLDSALMYNKDAERFLPAGDYKLANADLDYQFGVIYRYKTDFETSESYYKKVLEHKEKTKDSVGIARVYYAMACVKSEEQDFDAGVDLGLKSLAYFNAVEHRMGQSRAYNVLGSLLKDAGRDSVAIEYFLKGIKVTEPLDMKMDLANLYGNIGAAYFNIKDYKKSLEYYNKALKIDEAVGSKWGVGMILHNMSQIHIKEKNYAKAEEVLRRSLAIKQELGNKEEEALVSSILGFTLAKRGKFDEGRKFLEKSVAYGEKENLTQVMGEALEYSAMAYEAGGKYKEALDFKKRHFVFKDSIWKVNQESKFLETQTKFETKEKQAKIELLNKENEITSLQLSTVRKRNIILGIVSLLFAALVFVMYSLYKKIKEANKIKDVLLREIHHRVKNNLQVISSLLNLQSKSIDNPEAKEAILLGKTRVHSMSLIHQDLYKEDNLTGIEMKKYLEKLSNDLFYTYNISEGSIQLETEIENINLDVETVIPIGLIVNELISNALKYAFPDGKYGVIKVLLKEQQGKLILCVSDNGIGFDQAKAIAKNDESFGHFMVDIFKNKLDANLNIDGTAGTKIDLEIGKYKLAS